MIPKATPVVLVATRMAELKSESALTAVGYARILQQFLRALTV